MNLAFADAGFWVGLRDPRDQYHGIATQLLDKMMRERVHLVMTPFVFAEVHAHFSRAEKTRLRIIRDCWENPVVRMEQPSVPDQRQALEILKVHRDKAYSFCDALSFAVMLRLRIRGALTFDDHFRQFGQFDIIGGKLF